MEVTMWDLMFTLSVSWRETPPVSPFYGLRSVREMYKYNTYNRCIGNYTIRHVLRLEKAKEMDWHTK